MEVEDGRWVWIIGGGDWWVGWLVFVLEGRDGFLGSVHDRMGGGVSSFGNVVVVGWRGEERSKGLCTAWCSDDDEAFLSYLFVS